MIKVIEQENRYNIEVGLYGSCDVIILTHGNDLYRSGISIEKSKAREVALAICPELEYKLAEKDKDIEMLKDEKNEALRLLNDALKLIHSLPDLLHDSLGDHTAGNDYEITSLSGERYITHKWVGSGEPLKQWIKSEIDKILNGSK